jgi:hypothetical protein
MEKIILEKKPSRYDEEDIDENICQRGIEV